MFSRYTLPNLGVLGLKGYEWDTLQSMKNSKPQLAQEKRLKSDVETTHGASANLSQVQAQTAALNRKREAVIAAKQQV